MKFENVYSSTAERAREQAEQVVDGARSGARKVSKLADAGKKPVKMVADLGLRLTDISHSTTEKLVKQQASIVESEFDALADYFDDLAKSSDIRSFARLQLNVLPSFTRRALTNSRETVSLISEAGSNVRSLIGETIADARQKSPAKRVAKKAKAGVKKAKTAAKTTARKTKRKASKTTRKAAKAA